MCDFACILINVIHYKHLSQNLSLKQHFFASWPLYKTDLHAVIQAIPTLVHPSPDSQTSGPQVKERLHTHIC